MEITQIVRLPQGFNETDIDQAEYVKKLMRMFNRTYAFVDYSNNRLCILYPITMIEFYNQLLKDLHNSIIGTWITSVIMDPNDKLNILKSKGKPQIFYTADVLVSDGKESHVATIFPIKSPELTGDGTIECPHFNTISFALIEYKKPENNFKIPSLATVRDIRC